MQLRGSVFMAALFTAAAAFAQDMPQPPAQPPTVLRSEKRLVLVDAVVTDKKGEYVRDLTVKDFRVWEDKKEQSIESFSFEADRGSAASTQDRYLVLFFDNSTMDLPTQTRARRAALQFIDSNAGPKRMMAIVNFGGSLQIAQNFTTDKDRLKQVVNGVKFSSVSPNPEVASLGMLSLSRAEMDFGARDVLLSLRTLAKSLNGIPGRKTLIFLSAGFPLDSELRSELTAVISVCNRANVAVYPIDVRGLVARLHPPDSIPRLNQSVRLVNAAFVSQQRGGPTGGSGGPGAPRGGGNPPGGGGGRAPGMGGGGYNSGTRGMPGMYNPQNPMNQSRSIVPSIPNVLRNQEVLYALATGTGGFVIANTNDLLGGLQKIGSELNEYYVLGYTPESVEGTCHDLKVKVERGGTNVRARTGYCDTKPIDLLAGTAVEKNLETRAFAPAPGNVSASIETPFFYTSPNTARVDVAMEIAPNGLQFEKQKGKLHSEMNVLGIASDSGGAVAARFSDTVKFDFENKKEVEEFQTRVVHYETQFELASGNYQLKVVFTSGGANFGKLEKPLVVEPYDAKKFSLSGIALSGNIHRVTDLDVGLDAALLEDKKPLVSQGMQLVPSGSNVFQKTGPAAAYFEVYEPLLVSQNAPKVGIEMKVVDRKTGQPKFDSGFLSVLSFSHAGNPVIPVGFRLPVEKLDPGSYRAEFQAMDTAGNSSIVRIANFEIAQ